MRKIKVNAIKAKNLTSGEETPIPSVSPKGVILEQNDEVQKVQVLEPSDIQSCMKVTSHTLLWNKTTVITLPSIPCIVWGSRGNGSAEKGFMFTLDVYGSEFMNIKNSANATIAWGGRETKQLTVTLGNGTGSSITMYCAYV